MPNAAAPDVRRLPPVAETPKWLQRLAFIGVLILFVVASLEAVSTFAECGPFDCPNDGSWDWWLFNR